MSTAYYVTGDVRDVLAQMPEKSVNCIITSSPYWRKRAYLPPDHENKPLELGQEPSPGEFIDNLLDVTDLLWRVLRDDGVMFWNLGDTAAMSGGSGGDYKAGGLREGQPGFDGSAKTRYRKGDVPGKQSKAAGLRAKSVCWVPELFGASLAYGRNMITGKSCEQWITRPSITWCKPNPPVGEIIDKYREATELIIFATKSERYWFDLDAVRTPPDPANERGTEAAAGQSERHTIRTCNENGVPPLNWWKIASQPYSGDHFAVFPPELITIPVKSGCPAGGVILDPFGGSGTTGMVATGHGRDAVLIDFDDRNVHLARERIGMFMAEVKPEELGDLLGGES